MIERDCTPCTIGQIKAEQGPVWVDLAESSIANGLSFRPRTRVAETLELSAGPVPPGIDQRKWVAMQTWEISVVESSGVQSRSGSVGPTTARPTLVTGMPSGFLRLRIRPHGSNQTWLHDGRSTCVVTAPGVSVDVCVPDGAAFVSSGETLVNAGPASFIYSTFNARVVGVPSASRRVTELWTEDHGQPADPGGTEVPLMPGCQEIWYDGSLLNSLPGAALLVGPAPAQGYIAAGIPVLGDALARTWIPSLGASRVGIATAGTEEFNNVRVVQRGTL